MTKMDQILRKETKPFWFALGVTLVLKIVTILLEAFSPWPIKLLIDNVLGNQPLQWVGPLATFNHLVSSTQAIANAVVALFLVTNIALEVAQYAYAYLFNKLRRQITLHFAKLCFSNITYFDLSFFRQQEVGDYIYRLNNDVSSIAALIEDTLMPLLSSGLYLLITTIIMFRLDPHLTVLALAVLPFLGTSLYYFNKKIVRVTEQSERLNSSLFAFIQQVLNQLRIVQVFSQQAHEEKRYDERLVSSLNKEFALEKLNLLLSLLIGVIISVSYASILFIGIRDVMSGVLTTGILVVFIFYLDNLTSPVLTIIYALSSNKENQVKLRRLHEFVSDENQVKDTGQVVEMTDHSFRFEHVSLFGNEHAPILRDITCEIPQKKLTAIVGISGSGKSSFTSLIPRLLGDPEEGKIYLGGRDLREYSLQTLRQQIAYVPQESDLLNDTVYNIIAYGKSDATEREVHHAAHLAAAHDFILQLAHGYDTHVGENGNYLSGGQRQRLMLARAFLRDAPILVFDEPLSFLDIETRQIIWQNILTAAQGKTAIVVTNILSVIKQADQVIFMNNGKVIDVREKSSLRADADFFRLVASDN